jgi:ureidoacrylate peracid hydrolase
VINKKDISSIPIEGDTNFREQKIDKNNTALLVIDLQKGEYNPEIISKKPHDKYMWDRINNIVLPNGKKIIDKCRQNKVEVIYTVIESYTKDGRDRGIDYKISGIFCAKNSKEAEVLDEIKPLDDEIIIPKTSSSVFNSTNIEYVLRNLSIQYLMIFGIVTDQCVETAVRDGCDKGFLITLIEDACATHTQERHDNSLKGVKGYCRIRKTSDILEELT